MGSDESVGQNAWCGSFVAWVMKGIIWSLLKMLLGQKNGRALLSLLINLFTVLWGLNLEKGGGHVAFVVGQSPGGNYLYMRGDNQSNSVNVAKYKKQLWDDFVVPANFDPSSASLPIYTQKASVAWSEA